MDRTLQRSLIGSSLAHTGLLMLVLLGGSFAAKKVIETDVPVLEILPTDLRLTMGDQIGGGTPNPLPVASQDRTGPPPQAPPQTPVAPPPQVPVRPQPRVADPPPVVEPVSQPAPTTPPSKEVPKPTASKIQVAKDPRPVAKAQDVDPIQLASKPVKVSPSTAIQTSSAKRKRTEEDQRAATEAAEAAASASRARDQRLASVRGLAERLSGAVTGVSKNTGTSTKIEMLGPGGNAYAPYFSYLQAKLKQWWSKPATSSEKEAQVDVELSIARDGTVLSAVLKRRSGVDALNRSVEEIFRRHPVLQPLPPEFEGAKMVVPVSFVLESSESP